MSTGIKYLDESISLHITVIKFKPERDYEIPSQSTREKTILTR